MPKLDRELEKLENRQKKHGLNEQESNQLLLALDAKAVGMAFLNSHPESDYGILEETLNNLPAVINHVRSLR